MTTPLKDDKDAAATEEPTILQSLTDGLQQGRELIGRVLDLATLEARLATLSVVEMLALGVGIALMGFTIWLLVLAAIGATLIKFGLAWPWTLLLLGALAAVALLLGLKRARSLSENLRFAATRQALAGPPAVAPPAPAASASSTPLGNPHVDAGSQAPG